MTCGGFSPSSLTRKPLINSMGIPSAPCRCHARSSVIEWSESLCDQLPANLPRFGVINREHANGHATDEMSIGFLQLTRDDEHLGNRPPSRPGRPAIPEGARRFPKGESP